jgi:hypothetical protein
LVPTLARVVDLLTLDDSGLGVYPVAEIDVLVPPDGLV